MLAEACTREGVHDGDPGVSNSFTEAVWHMRGVEPPASKCLPRSPVLGGDPATSNSSVEAARHDDDEHVRAEAKRVVPRPA